MLAGTGLPFSNTAEPLHTSAAFCKAGESKLHCLIPDRREGSHFRPMHVRPFTRTLAALALLGRVSAAELPPDFGEVYRLLDEHCIECHTADDPEANLVL